ncbi:WD40 repeat domain-containing protein [Tolypothrix sp. FACHB-123]|uniref:WD40 repeat domain-containing protein n=1 Tax=Tolypothrix sp. FACHB-123 TaxID=2692868 RepID=UPI001684B4A9|nr:WD40 repeat domain-containing protein [Tolypothrix sp. FACHB-123]MBD2357383.1 WD40 repeat domain-containing protein [Tolypothrix sp. FACHB-123]
MNQQKNLELVKQGNPQAIEDLLNQALQSKCIKAKTALKDKCLQVLFESAQIPSQEKLVTWLYEGMTKLHIETIEKLNIYGRQLGKEIPDWTQEILLNQGLNPDSHKLPIENKPINDISTVDYSKLRLISTLGHDIVPYTSVVFTSDSKTLISGGKELILWNVDKQKIIRVLSGHTGNPAVTSVAISPNGDWIASGGSGDSLVKQWNLREFLESDGGRTRNLVGHKGTWLSNIDTRLNPTITSIAFSPDGNLIASSGCDKKVKLWDAETGNEIYTISESQVVASLVFSTNGKLLIGGINKNVKLWNLETKEESTFTTRAPVSSVAINPNGHILACGDMFGGITLWDLKSRQIINILSLYFDSVSNAINTIAFSPDGLSLATGSSNKIIKVIPILTTNNEATLIGHTDSINAVCFSPDGFKLASASNDKTIKIWNISVN